MQHIFNKAAALCYFSTNKSFYKLKKQPSLMKKLFPLLLLISVITSCSKSTDNTKPDNKNPITLPAQVTIGSLTWTSVNYNGDGGVNYNNNIVNDATIGKLYTVAEAKALKLPTGWRIPTTADFNNLMSVAGAINKDSNGNYIADETPSSKLMAKTTWDIHIGTNGTGFNAFPAGYASNDGPSYFQKSAGFHYSSIAAAFISSSAFTGPQGGDAYFTIYQNTSNVPAFTLANTVTFVPATAPSGSTRASLRFVKDN